MVTLSWMETDIPEREKIHCNLLSACMSFRCHELRFGMLIYLIKGKLELGKFLPSVRILFQGTNSG